MNEVPIIRLSAVDVAVGPPMLELFNPLEGDIRILIRTVLAIEPPSFLLLPTFWDRLVLLYRRVIQWTRR